MLHKKNSIKIVNIIVTSISLFLFSGYTQALELVAGDYELLPPGSTVVLQYIQHAERSDYFADSKKVQTDFNLDSDIGITRFIHAIELNDRTNFNANLIIPYGRLEGKDQASFLGKESGMSDLITGGAFEFLLDKESLDSFGIGTFVHVPTGDYDNDSPLNLGENRWKFLLQLVYTKHFNPTWALDLSSDALFFGKNDDLGPSSLELKQKPRYELQGHLRYNVSPATALTLGLGNIRGAESKIEGVDQNDDLDTTYARIGFNHWLNQTTQVSVQLGKDIDIKNGAKEDSRINIRFARVF